MVGHFHNRESISQSLSENVSGGYQYLEALIVLIGWNYDVTETKIVRKKLSGFISERY
jgi:hypothetical protein